MNISLNINGNYNFKLSGVTDSERTGKSAQTSVNGYATQGINDAVELSDRARLQAYIDAHYREPTQENMKRVAKQVTAEHLAMTSGVDFYDDGWAAGMETNSDGSFKAGNFKTLAERTPGIEIRQLTDAEKTDFAVGKIDTSNLQANLSPGSLYDIKQTFGDANPFSSFTKDIPEENFMQEGLCRYKALQETVIDRVVSGQAKAGTSPGKLDIILTALNDIDYAFESYLFEGFKQAGMSESDAREVSMQFGVDFRTARNSGLSLEDSFSSALAILNEVGYQFS